MAARIWRTPSGRTTSQRGEPVSSHSAVDVIRTKRDGGRLSDDQIRWFMTSYTAGEVADEQAAALAMAIFWRGMEPDELARRAGNRVALERPRVQEWAPTLSASFANSAAALPPDWEQ